MEQSLAFFLVPVPDIKVAKRFYRDVLGLQESWREGDTTVAFKLPGTEVELMVDQLVEGGPDKPGPVFLIPSVDEFHSQEQGRMAFTGPPADIPGGRWVSANDGSGNGVYFIDQSRAQA